MKGLFGGTFNPIHFGHINLAIELKEKANLSEIWMVPAHISPFRTQEPLVVAEKRLTMVELAVQEIPGFRVLDLEVKRSGPSYTIDTIKEILSTGEEIVLILGEDALTGFDRWKEYEEIIRQVPLVVGSRQGSQRATFPPEVESAIKKGTTPTSLMEISATALRQRLKKRLYCGHLMPSKVLDYIYENQLY